MRGLGKYLFVLLLPGLLLAGRVDAQSQWRCATPGMDGHAKLSGVVNDYWAAPPTVSLQAGQTRLPLGDHRGKTNLAVGDLLLVIQMQGATINSSNDMRYGSGSGQGRGWTGIVAGHFEMVRVQQVQADVVVISAAGPGNGLRFPYLSRDPQVRSDQGRARWQLVRIPQYQSAQLTGDLKALPWNGVSGGVLALDVRGKLNLAGHRLDAAQMGFRGGASFPLHGALGAANDLRYGAPSVADLANGYGQHGSKGEGLAGTPRWLIVDGSRLDTLPNEGRNVSDGYPGGSMARGAPANAGGGGESLSLDNRIVSGGGGGGGGLGGDTGADGKGRLEGGLGGVGVGVEASGAPLLVMGGGGGGAGLGGRPEWQGAGGVGGGILLVMAGSINGPGSLDVDGGKGANGPAGGGGGGAGSILLWSPAAADVPVTLERDGGLGGKGPQGRGGNGGLGRLLLAGDVAPALKERLDVHKWLDVAPGFLCEPEGRRAAGFVFNDPEKGADPLHAGLAGWSYHLSAGSQILAQGVTDAQGHFMLMLPPDDKVLMLSVDLPPNWLAVTANHDEAAGLAYQGNGRWQLTPTGSNYFQELRLGVLQQPDIEMPPSRQVAVNSTQIFPVRYVAHARAKVDFTAQTTLAGVSDTKPLMFIDPHCDGHSQFAAGGSSQVFDVAPGQAFCVRLRVEVGSTQQAGQALDWQLEATTQFGRGLPAQVQGVQQHYLLVPASSSHD